MSSHDDEPHDDLPMHRRMTTMPDGRYLYYYTFDEDVEGGTATTSDASDVAEPRDV